MRGQGLGFRFHKVCLASLAEKLKCSLNWAWVALSVSSCLPKMKRNFARPCCFNNPPTKSSLFCWSFHLR
uniref:Z25f protein n=1 Tax=Vibrio cholerae TaxID=666 RepID=O87032_VIBCL|nr:z25f [Vibrio cholerae]